MPFRGSVELLLGGQLIEAVALSLESELLSSLGPLGGTHGAELCPGLSQAPSHPVRPYRNRASWEAAAPFLPESGGGNSSPFQLKRQGDWVSGLPGAVVLPASL